MKGKIIGHSNIITIGLNKINSISSHEVGGSRI